MPKYAKGYGDILFGSVVPSEDLALPPGAKFTAVELLTYLPLSLKSHNVVYRFASNGCPRNILWAIIDHNRNFDRPWHVNSCGEMIYQTMREAGYDNWTFKTHATWHTKAAAKTWNVELLTIPDIQPPSKNGKKTGAAAPIQFKSLANGVKAPPQGSDALDLTRMVDYAILHPSESWLYPDDYAELLNTIGGKAKVTLDHTDKYLSNRWTEKLRREASRMPKPIPRPTKKQVHFAADAPDPGEKSIVAPTPQPQGRRDRGRPPKNALSIPWLDNGEPHGPVHHKLPSPASVLQGLRSSTPDLDADVAMAEADIEFLPKMENEKILDTVTRVDTIFSDQSVRKMRDAFSNELFGSLPEAGKTFFNPSDVNAPFESAATLMGGEGWWMDGGDDFSIVIVQ
jgi:hypothetical protein